MLVEITGQQTFHKSHPYLLIGNVKRIKFRQFGIIFYRDITALVEQRGNVRHPLCRCIERFGNNFPTSDLLGLYMVFVQHLDQIGWCTTAEPIRTDFTVRKSIQQAERIINVGRWISKMITVIIIPQTCNKFRTGNLHPARKQFQIMIHLRQHLIFRDTANSGIWTVHADILYIVQFTEYTQLRELRNTGKEDIAQIRIASLQRTVEITHHVS